MLRLFLMLALAGSQVASPAADWPNIVFLLADDLGLGDVGCYGQTKIRTPNLDRLAAEGMRFTSFYSGHNVCAPSRCVLMTGLHPGHAYIRENKQAKALGLPFEEGQAPVPENYLTLPLNFKNIGYVSGAFGKWGLGPVGSSGDPLKQGFDRFFGYNCQAAAHNYYPAALWDNDQQITLPNDPFSAHQKLAATDDPLNPSAYVRFTGKTYAPDVINAAARKFLEANHTRPFFLFYPTTVPHLALQVPEDSLAEYRGKFSEEPYTGGRNYLPHRTPHAAYAAMITRLDAEIGRLTQMVKDFGLEERTIFIFTSDNGPLYDRLGGTDTDFFNSAAGLRGRKGAFYEGGIRVPCIVRWKGRIAPGSLSDRIAGFEDWLPTLLELVGAPEQIPADIDGLSFAPTLLGKAQAPRPFLYRESPGYGGQQSVRQGDWKAIRTALNRGNDLSKIKTELYNLAEDPGETRDVAARHPDRVKALEKIMAEQHRPSKLFPIAALDGSPPPSGKNQRKKPD